MVKQPLSDSTAHSQDSVLQVEQQARQAGGCGVGQQQVRQHGNLVPAAPQAGVGPAGPMQCWELLKSLLKKADIKTQISHRFIKTTLHTWDWQTAGWVAGSDAPDTGMQCIGPTTFCPLHAPSRTATPHLHTHLRMLASVQHRKRPQLHQLKCLRVLLQCAGIQKSQAPAGSFMVDQPYKGREQTDKAQLAW